LASCLRQCHSAHHVDEDAAATDHVARDSVHIRMITGQLADSPTRGLPTRGLDISRTSQLGDWRSRGLDNSRSREWPKNENYARKVAGGIRELSSPRVVESASWRIRELSSNRYHLSLRRHRNIHRN